MRPFAIFILLAFVGQASAGPNAKTGGSASTAVISSTRFPGDFDWDFDVDFADFLAFVSVFGKTSADADYNPRMDMDGSGAINFADFVTFAGVFGRTYTRPPWAADRDALIALYHATDGDSWTDRTNWLTNADLSTWHGVTVSNGRVTRLGLGGNNLSGSIPSELGDLSNLEILWLSGNALIGSIPPALGHLSNLNSLLLSGNALIGSIPAALGSLSNLNSLLLDSNALSGSIPPALGDLSNLEILWLSGNALSRSIPSELGNLSNLADLRLDDNVRLTGTLPQSLTRLTNLKHFHFHNTGLCAPFDRAFHPWLRGIEDARGSTCPGGGTLSTDRDALVALYNATDGDSWTHKANWLTDADLSTWHGVTVSDGRVTRLWLSVNALSGSIPPALGDLSSLQELFLNTNELSGPIPSELGNLSNLTDLGLYGNELSGPIPSELGNLSNLIELFLSSNALSGSIPPALGNLSSLQDLRLDNNALSGSIPPALGNLSNLHGLLLNDNTSLTGTLPQSLTRLTNLKYFHFHNTGLCASLDGAFQTWFQSIEDTHGSTCSSSG